MRLFDPADLATLRPWLLEHVCPFWLERVRDPVGGFLEELDSLGSPIARARRTTLVQARLTYVFSHAYLLSGDPAFRQAARHGLAVIEDGGQSFGALYHGRRSCALSTIGTTSFFPTKALGCYGDGGACFTDDDALAERMRQIRVHGQSRRYYHPIIGINARLDTLQAAVLLAKVEVLAEDLAARERIGRRYGEKLAGAVRTPYIEPHNRSVYAQYTIEVDARTDVQARLKAEGIPTAVHYPLPLHLQPAFAGLGLGEGSFPKSEAAARRVMSLPMHPDLDEATQDRIVAAVRSAVAVRTAA